MAPATTLTARSSTATVVAHASNVDISTGSIVGIFIGSLLGILALCVCIYYTRKHYNYAQALEQWLRGPQSAEPTSANVQQRDSAEHTDMRTRKGSYEGTTELGAKWERSRSTPNIDAAARRAESDGNEITRAPSAPVSEVKAPRSITVAGLRRSGQSEAAYDMTASDFERLAFSDPGTGSRAADTVQPGASRRPPLSRSGTLATHTEMVDDGAHTEFWRTPEGEDVLPQQSISNMPTQRVMVRKKAPSPSGPRKAKDDFFRSERDIDKEWDRYWRDQMAAESSRRSPAPASPATGRSRDNTEEWPGETSRQRLERIEKEIAHLRRAEITRQAEIELKTRVRSSDPAVKPKERSRVEQWIHSTTKPTLNHVPIGDGSEFLSDITTKSALEFPRWGESVASALEHQSALLSDDPWRDEVRRNRLARRGG